MCISNDVTMMIGSGVTLYDATSSVTDHILKPTIELNGKLITTLPLVTMFTVYINNNQSTNHITDEYLNLEPGMNMFTCASANQLVTFIESVNHLHIILYPNVQCSYFNFSILLTVALLKCIPYLSNHFFKFFYSFM